VTVVTRRGLNFDSGFHRMSSTVLAASAFKPEDNVLQAEIKK
jgi:hypothetical protein